MNDWDRLRLSILLADRRIRFWRDTARFLAWVLMLENIAFAILWIITK